MKIGIITDTNILTKKMGEDKSRLSTEKNFLDNIDFFTNYINDLNSLKTKNEIVYLMPETIIDELVCQKVQAYNDSYKAFSEKYKNIGYGLKGNLPENNIIEVVNNEKKVYLGKVTVIKLKYQNKIFKELVKEAINKLPPFDKSEERRKSDAGFKDALIWKTILYSEEINNFDKIYFFSGDNIFEKNSEIFNEQFKKEHPDTDLILKFILPDNEKIQNCLKVIIDENELPQTDCIKLYNKTFILEYIRRLNYDYIHTVKLNNVVYNEQEVFLEEVKFEKFDEEDFIIEEVKKVEDKFMVNIIFKTRKYTISPKEVILPEKRYVEGKINFKISKNKEEFIVEESKIVKIKFRKTFQEIMQDISNTWLNNSTYLFFESLKDTVAPLKEAYNNFLNNIVPFSNYNFDNNINGLNSNNIIDDSDNDNNDNNSQDNQEVLPKNE